MKMNLESGKRIMQRTLNNELNCKCKQQSHFEKEEVIETISIPLGHTEPKVIFIYE